MKFPVNSLLAGSLAFSETSSQLTPPSTGESRTNLASCLTAGASTDCGALDCPGGAQDADPGVVRSRAGPEVRILFPPSASLLRT